MASPEPSPLEIVRRINRFWQDGRVEPIAEYLHPAMVIVHPGFSGRAAGAEAVLQSFREYLDNAETLAISESDHQEDLVGDTAVVTYRFEATYDYQGKRYEGSGRDVWILELGDDGWRAVWRTMVDLDEAEVGNGG